MITVITNKTRIADLHKRFHKQLNKFLTERINCWVGFPGGNFEDRVKYSQELNIWLSNFDHANRFWNGFGVGRPIEGRNNTLNGEINFPYEGIYRRVAGAFAEEENGTILVLHRGKIGGGKPGIGKQYFTENFRGDFVIAIDGDRETEFCLIGELQSPHFSRQVSNFINEIYRVKQIENDIKSNKFEYLNNFKFTDEHSGRSKTKNHGTKTIERTHGIIVNELASQLLQRKYKIGNDRNRDLFIHKQNRVTNIFEIKTSCTTQNLYAAVGQLIIYSIPIRNEVTLIIVLPEKLSAPVEKRLLKHGIKPLYYEWNGELPTFSNLDRLIV
jgi:hypothetical protein